MMIIITVVYKNEKRYRNRAADNVQHGEPHKRVRFLELCYMKEKRSRHLRNIFRNQHLLCTAATAFYKGNDISSLSLLSL